MHRGSNTNPGHLRTSQRTHGTYLYRVVVLSGNAFFLGEHARLRNDRNDAIRRNHRGRYDPHPRRACESAAERHRRCAE
jgi:hypothetical protein